jgi:stage V sporulation protein SpoVS
VSLDLETSQHKEFRVKNSTPVKNLASAISQHILENKKVVLSAIGAGAVNQATKAVIVAGQTLSANNIILYSRDAFHTSPGKKVEDSEVEDNHTVIRKFLKAEYGS